MITIIVGTPGAGKTLYTITEIRKKYEDSLIRYYNIPEVKIDDWQELEDPYEWHNSPTGTTVIIDEAHEVFAQRDHKKDTPAHIEAAATLRHRGQNLVLITQHPMDLSVFMRRRCARFIYLEQPMTKKPYANVWEWNKYTDQFHNEFEQKKADNYRFDFPVEAFDLYKSASLHTKKRVTPKALKRAYGIVAICALVFISAMFYLKDRFTPDEEFKQASITSPTGLSIGKSKVNDEQSFVDYYKPRIAAIPYSAPIYDSVLDANTFPKAHCLSSENKCECYTQQATRLHIAEKYCRIYVRDGFFDHTKKLNKGGA